MLLEIFSYYTDEKENLNSKQYQGILLKKQWQRGKWKDATKNAMNKDISE